MPTSPKHPSKTTPSNQPTKPRAQIADLGSAYRLFGFFKKAPRSSTTPDAASLGRGGFARINEDEHRREIDHANTRAWETGAGIEKREENGRIGQEMRAVGTLQRRREERAERARADEGYDREMFDPYKDGSDIRYAIYQDQDVNDWVANQKRGVDETEDLTITADAVARTMPSTNPDAATTGELSSRPTGHPEPQPQKGSLVPTAAGYPLTGGNVPNSTSQPVDSVPSESNKTPYLDQRTLKTLNSVDFAPMFRLHNRDTPERDNKLLGLDIPAWHDSMREWTDGKYNPYLAIRPNYADTCPLAWALLVSGFLMLSFVALYLCLSRIWEYGLWRRFKTTPGLFSGYRSNKRSSKRIITQSRAGRKLRAKGKANYNRLLRQYRKERRNGTFFGSFGEYKVLVKRQEIEERQDREYEKLGKWEVFLGLFGLGFARAEEEELDDWRTVNGRGKEDGEEWKQEKYGEV